MTYCSRHTGLQSLAKVFHTFSNWIVVARQFRSTVVHPSTRELFWALTAAYGKLPALPLKMTICLRSGEFGGHSSF